MFLGVYRLGNAKSSANLLRNPQSRKPSCAYKQQRCFDGYYLSTADRNTTCKFSRSNPELIYRKPAVGVPYRSCQGAPTWDVESVTCCGCVSSHRLRRRQQHGTEADDAGHDCGDL